MNRISKLIDELCPEGIPFKPLAEVSNLKAGERIIKSMMKPGLDYAVYGGGTAPTGYYDKHNAEASITISRAGSAGHVSWVENKFWATDVCFIASQKQSDIIIKFIYYFLKSQQSNLQKHLYGGSMPKLDKLFLWKLPIPIPPLEVQKEIVNILDKFTQLEAELSAELSARRQQHAHYWNYLLAANDTWKTTTLGEIADVFDGPHATPKKTTTGPWYLSISSLKNGRVDLTESAHLSENEYPKWIRRVVSTSPNPKQPISSQASLAA